MPNKTPDQKPIRGKGAVGKGKRPRPVDDEMRSEVARLHGLGYTRNEIAREVGCAGSTVGLIAAAHEPPLLFDRALTALAVEAHRIDMAVKRADLQRKLLVRADEALEAMDQPALVFSFGGKDNDYNERVLDAPTTADQRNLMTIAGIALQRESDLRRVDTTSGVEEGVSLLDSLSTGLAAAADRLRGNTSGVEEGGNGE